MGKGNNGTAELREKYVVDGKRYDSVEEMPEGIRQEFKAALEARDSKLAGAQAKGWQAALEMLDAEARQKALARMVIEPEHHSRGYRLVVTAAVATVLIIIVYVVVHWLAR
jgi:hypothetical protein